MSQKRRAKTGIVAVMHDPAPVATLDHDQRHERDRIKTERAARPSFAAKELAEAIIKLIIAFPDAREVKPDFRRAQEALRMVDAALPRRWTREFATFVPDRGPIKE